MEDPECSLQRYVELNLTFHGQIAEASANRVLQALQLAIRTMQGVRVAALYSVEDRVDVIAEHTAVLEALRAGNVWGAEEAMGAHLHGFLEFLRKHHPDVLNQRLEPLMPASVAMDALGGTEPF